MAILQKKLLISNGIITITKTVTQLPYLTVYKTHGCIRHTPISAEQIKKKTKY